GLRKRVEDAVELELLGLQLLDLALLLAVLELLGILVLVLHLLAVLELLALLPRLILAVEVVLLPVLAVPEVLAGAELTEDGGDVAHRETADRGVGFEPDLGTVDLRDEGLLAGLIGVVVGHCRASLVKRDCGARL